MWNLSSTESQKAPRRIGDRYSGVSIPIGVCLDCIEFPLGEAAKVGVDVKRTCLAKRSGKDRQVGVLNIDVQPYPIIGRIEVVPAIRGNEQLTRHGPDCGQECELERCQYGSIGGSGLLRWARAAPFGSTKKESRSFLCEQSRLCLAPDVIHDCVAVRQEVSCNVSA